MNSIGRLFLRTLRRARAMACAEKSRPVTCHPCSASVMAFVPVPQPMSSARALGFDSMKRMSSGGEMPVSHGARPSR